VGSLINFKLVKIKLTVLLVFLVFIGNAQTLQVNIFGGAIVNDGDVINITAGQSLEFQITNSETTNCKKLKIDNIYYTNSPTYDAYQSSGWWNIKPSSCKGNKDHLNFVVRNNSPTCTSSSTIVTIETKKSGNLSFTLSVTGSPVISVSGGSPLASITNGATTTTATNGTYFGVVESGNTRTHGFYITNTGSCDLNVSGAITSDLSNFVVGTPIDPPSTPLTYPFNITPGASVYFPITFSVGAATGLVEAIITIPNNDTSFTFKVEAEVFNYDIPGPGGINADFRLWLKANRGVVSDGSSKVSQWTDRGSNGKNATAVAGNEPTYIDDATNNINFNPVIKFENNGSTINQYLVNDFNGFYTQEIFVVMKSDVDVTTSTGMTILSGTVSNYSNTDGSFSGDANYDNDGDSNMNDVDPNSNPTNDVTGIGLANFSSRLTGERLWYNQGSVTSNPYYTIEGSNTETYSNAQILNVHNKTATVTDGLRFMYNGIDPAVSATSNITYDNLGYDNAGTWFGTPYKIGKNINDIYGNLNGRVAEIMTYATRVPDADRPKIETYLAIKYGITLGVNGTSKDYISSNGTVIWDVSANAGYNYNIAGIGRDDTSDLNQKQSKSINDPNEVTIYLENIFATNSANVNEFSNDLNSLVWGCNNGAFSGIATNSIVVGPSLSTTITKIDRNWKIVPTVGVGQDMGHFFVSIPTAAFSIGFNKLSTEEYSLIVSDTKNFADEDIIDIIPLKSDGAGNLFTWYDFESTMFFSFCKAPKITSNSLINITTGDYLVGESGLDLNIDAFTVSAWVRAVNSSANPRTIMAKGDKIQMRLNTSNQVEIVANNSGTPVFTSTMVISDIKWHHLSFVFQSGTVFLYIDGVLDKSIQNIESPTPNFNHFSVGVLLDVHTTSNPFMGEIDEISIFDYALTYPQVRYLMNQEIVKTSGAKVSGKVIPETTSSSEVNAFDWSQLKAYYDFNSFYGTTVEGLTDNRNFLRINYLSKGKSIVNTQTAPLPYVSASNGAWGTAATWVNGDKQNLPNSLGLDGSTEIDWNIVEIGHNITSGDKDIAVLGLISTGGKLTIANTTDPQDETNGGQGLHVSHYLELDGVIDLVGESQLVQYEGSILDEDSGGHLERDQQGTASSYNYNDWSSSVQPISGNAAARGTGVSNTNANHSISVVLKDGAQDINFSSSYTAADVGTTAPITLSSYWFYKFNGPEDDYNAWASINENTALLSGEGYTMKGTSGAALVTANQNYKFKGKPNNGTITLPIITGNARLIGNPYPSALDANEFILDNIKETINEEEGTNTLNIFNGALYFFHHFGQAGSHNLSDYVAGYATYTLMGGIEAFSTDSRIDNSTPLVGGGKIPERYIPVNQGFFVIALLDAALDSTTTSVDGGDIIFKNSQRVFVREGFTGTNDGSLFFKTSKKSKTNEVLKNVDERSKIRLQFSSPNGFNRNLLVGEDVNATNNFDIGYDGPLADLGKNDMFWFFNNSKFVIQAVNNFDKNQELPLGIKLEKDGLVNIKIDSLENIDKNVEIYIKDKSIGETYQINNQAFELNLTAGEYLNRFALVFQPRLKTLKEITLVEGVNVFMNNTISELQIKKIVDTEISEINLYNYLGQNVGSWVGDFKEREISIPINKQTGAYIVQITTKNNGVLSKKIIIE
tara:strand:+ start:19251 stop:24212 length:4962 start_codon:yes stop_codon:yes gene_type:complete